MAHSRESLVNKVLRAMALANDAGAEQGERDHAARTAARLIGRHQIEEAELREVQKAKGGQDPVAVMFEFPVSNLGGFGKERADALAWAAVHSFGGTTYRSFWKSATMPTLLKVFVREDLKEVVLVLLEALHTQLMTMEKAATKEYVQDEADRLHRYNWITLTPSQRSQKAVEFRRGYIPSWGRNVARRITTGRKEALAEAQAEKQVQAQAERRMEAQAEAYARGATGEELFAIEARLTEQEQNAIAAKLSSGMELALVDDKKTAEAAMQAHILSVHKKPLKESRKPREDIRVAFEGERAGRKDAYRTDIGLTRIG